MQIYYLTLADALLIHQKMIVEFGGDEGVRDKGLLEAALLRPQTGHYADIIEEAAALWESLVMYHAFVDGNKRVGTAAANIFLEANNVFIEADNKSLLGFVMKNLEQGTFNRDNLDQWLRKNAQSRHNNEE